MNQSKEDKFKADCKVWENLIKEEVAKKEKFEALKKQGIKSYDSLNKEVELIEEVISDSEKTIKQLNQCLENRIKAEK